jgi:hypothetical protein
VIVNVFTHNTEAVVVWKCGGRRKTWDSGIETAGRVLFLSGLFAF